MTREEAIEKLELMRQKVDEETYRALILAIKALENHDTFMKYAYSQGKQDALSKEPCRNGEMRNEKTPTNHGCFSEISKKISNSLL